jgi:hypothetical protein
MRKLENSIGLFGIRGVSSLIDTYCVVAVLLLLHTWFSPYSNILGQYWGEMGFFRILMGKNLLGIEGEIAWATPGQFTVDNFPCAEDGKNCNTHIYQDPSENVEAVQRRLTEHRK